MSAATRPTESKTLGVSASVKRQCLNFSFFKTAPSWNLLSEEERNIARKEFAELVEGSRKDLLVYTYSLVGLRADTDFLIWRIGWSLEDIQRMSEDQKISKLGRHLQVSHSFNAMTKRSQYVDKIDPHHSEQRTRIHVGSGKYLFVYPFVKKREWYVLPIEERQAMMDEHIRIGNKYPSVKLHTSYSFGIDDQEFVVAFETDQPEDFLDLVQELRESKGSLYTLRDTPILTCIRRPIAEILSIL